MIYEVRLPVFEGPLDLLLHLIEKQELDITSISLAQVTDQYLDYVSRLERIDAAALADFLLVAAKLLLIKSQMLLPKPPEVEAEEEAVSEDLVRQLIEYKRFKEAARTLQERWDAGLRAYVRVAPPPELSREIDLGDVSSADLIEALRRALEEQPTLPVNNVVTPLVVSIEQKMRHIQRWLQRRPRVTFREMLARAKSRLEVIVSFLALLELIKQRRVRVEQKQLFGEIVITAREPPQK
jgi:segregation and condensation protein A